MIKRAHLIGLVVLALLALGGEACAKCALGQVAALHVTMEGTRPIVSAGVNGVKTNFLADSGAFFNMMSEASAAELKLKLGPAPPNLRVIGLGGDTDVSLATVSHFDLAGQTVANVAFIVGGGEAGNDVAGVIGENVLTLADTEYDLANGVIRLIRPTGCGPGALAYWAQSLPIGELDIAASTPLAPSPTGAAFINGARIRVVFDSGAGVSMLAIGAARRLGLDPRKMGDVAVAAGFGRGVGRRTVETWIIPVDSFKIGGEEIRRTRLRVGDFSLFDADMLLGADFFLSHRIYVAKSQRKLYFTYNGGPVFNLDAPATTQTASGDTSPAPVNAAPVEVTPPVDAAGFSRRGSAEAGRHDYARAITDLSRACDLAPNEPTYFFQRAMAYLDNKQPTLALADLDHTLTLAADDSRAHVVRAELRLAGHDTAAAMADLDAVARSAAKEADVRLRLAADYQRGGAFAPAVAQYDLWLKAHPDDSRQPFALAGRCRARALGGQDLGKALADCDTAVRHNAKDVAALDSRGLVHLRLGETDRALADFNAALKLDPKLAWSLYGRGVAKLRQGLTTDGRTDIAAATALQPHLPQEAKTLGLAP